MEAMCKFNPPGNPYWCEVIQGYCQFQTEKGINDICPILPAYSGWPPPYTDDVDDWFMQTYGFATIYDNGTQLVSLGDSALRMYDPSKTVSLALPDLRYIGEHAFEDCVKLALLDFSGKKDGFIPVLASPQAFMMSDGSGFVNDTFRIKVPASLYDAWISSPNWAALKKHITKA